MRTTLPINPITPPINHSLPPRTRPPSNSTGPTRIRQRAPRTPGTSPSSNASLFSTLQLLSSTTPPLNPWRRTSRPPAVSESLTSARSIPRLARNRGARATNVSAYTRFPPMHLLTLADSWCGRSGCDIAEQPRRCEPVLPRSRAIATVVPAVAKLGRANGEHIAII
ncbi:hypothetical protein BC834DRAFT_325941 [Gloeopeniophorella convolvens]|nr:hypothetical protein BC834DRAFT_325941 [Gloeopeniophorella convolvens]